MAEAGVNSACQNLTRQDVEEETTGMYARRVLAGTIRPSAPTASYVMPNGSGPDKLITQCLLSLFEAAVLRNR